MTTPLPSEIVPPQRSKGAVVRRVRGLARAASSARSFGAHVMLTSGSNILLALLGVVTGALAARLLGPDGRGQLAAIQMWPNFLAAIANLGLPEAVVYFSARSTPNSGRYLGSAVVMTLLVSAAFLAAGYFALPLLLPAQSADVIWAARWYLLLLPVQAIYLPQHSFRGLSDFTAWNALRFLAGFGWLAVLVYGALSGHTAPAFFALAYLAVLTVLALPMLQLTWRRVPRPYRPDVREWMPMLRFGLPSVTSGVPRMLNLRLDQMLMAALLPAHTLGLYVVAVTWSNAVSPLPSALANVLFPRTAAQTRPEDRHRVFAKGIRFAVLSTVSVAAAVLVVTPWMIPTLFGAAFADAIPAAFVLVVAAAIASVNMVIEEGLRGLGRPVMVLWAELAGLAVTAVALLFLLRPFGIMGAALASVVGYTAVLITLVVASRALTQLAPLDMLRPGRAELEQVWRASRRLIDRLLVKHNAEPAID
jgi:O-antigen/teichoic acid export membrane protein